MSTLRPSAARMMRWPPCGARRRTTLMPCLKTWPATTAPNMTQQTLSRERIRDDVKEYLANTFLRASRGPALRDDDDLLLVLNSLQLLRMVIELETRFGVTIGNGEVTPENLGTVERIATFIEQKRG